MCDQSYTRRHDEPLPASPTIRQLGQGSRSVNFRAQARDAKPDVAPGRRIRAGEGRNAHLRQRRAKEKPHLDCEAGQGKSVSLWEDVFPQPPHRSMANKR